MNANDIDFGIIKLIRGVPQEKEFIRDLNVIKSMTAEKYQQLVNYTLDIYLKNEPLDSKDLEKWIENFGETTSVTKSAMDISLFLFRNATKYNLTEEDFKSDLDNLDLSVHENILMQLYTKFKNELKDKSKEKRTFFQDRLMGCEWQLNQPFKVSVGKLYDDLIISLNLQVLDVGADSVKKISFETDTMILRSILLNLEECLKEAESWQKMK